MNGQVSFDRSIARAMTRRQFLAGLARASAAAAVVSSTLGCGRVRGRIERVRLGDAAPVFNPVQRQVVAKIVDGFNPPDTEIRRRLAREDPDFDPVAVYAEYAWATGDEFLASMRFLIDFINILPSFTRTFSTRYDTTLTADLVRSERIQITSGHPMGGCALGGNPKRDVVDSRGRSWDVDGLYVADSSILPTSMGVNPCYTVYALGRYIAQGIVEDVRAASPSSVS
jgi:choline dehydrogenase-like flavoprotein